MLAKQKHEPKSNRGIELKIKRISIMCLSNLMTAKSYTMFLPPFARE